MDEHCGCRSITTLLGMGEESRALVRMDLFKELSAWHDEYATIVSGHERVEQLKR